MGGLLGTQSSILLESPVATARAAGLAFDPF